MNINISNLILLLGVQYFLFLVVYAEDKLCKQAVSEITKKQLKGVTECTKSMNFKNAKEKQKRMTCVMKCVFRREGIIGEDGKADPLGSLKFITLHFPDHVQEHCRNVMMQCLEPAVSVDPDEESCKTYDPLVKCALQSLNQFCAGPASKKL